MKPQTLVSAIVETIIDAFVALLAMIEQCLSWLDASE